MTTKTTRAARRRPPATAKGNPRRAAAKPVASPVRERVLLALRNAIISGRLSPGQRLVEADLCQSLKVSRPSVREALRQLEAERLVTITPYKGPSVASVAWPEASDIYEVRVLLEGHAAYLCAERIDSQSVERMREALEAFEAAVRIGDSAGLIESTGAFYDEILRGCENSIIEETLRALLARINLLRSRSMSLRGRSTHSARELRAIYLAIKRRDAERAREAAIEHVRNARAAARVALDLGGSLHASEAK